MCLGALLGLGEHAGELRRQEVGAADVLHAPVALARELVGELGDDLEEVGELLRVALGQVVGRQQVQRHDADADVVAPSEELAHLRRAGAVAVRGGGEAELAGPAAIAVDHHRDMVGHRRGFESAAESIDVEPIEGPSTLIRRSARHIAYATAIDARAHASALAGEDRYVPPRACAGA